MSYLKLFLFLQLIFFSSCYIQEKKYTKLDHLDIAIGSLPSEIDPIQNWNYHHLNLFRSLYSTLTRVNSNGKIVSDLASSWSVDLKSKTITFEVNKLAKFSNGDTVTAFDVAFSFSRHYWPSAKYNSRHLLFWLTDKTTILNEGAILSNLKIINSHSLQFKFINYHSAAMEIISNPAFGIVSSKNVHIGSGPMTINTKKSSKKNWALERNKFYFLNQPKISTINISSIENKNTFLKKIQDQQYDIFFGAGIDVTQTDRISNAYVINKYNCFCNHHLYFNFRNKFFMNKKIRFLIGHYIQQTLQDPILVNSKLELLKPIKTYFPSGIMPITYYKKNNTDKIDAKSISIFKKYFKNVKLKISLAANTLYPKTESTLKLKLQEIGIQSEIKMLRGEEWAKNLQARSYDIISTPNCMTYSDPDSLIEVFENKDPNLSVFVLNADRLIQEIGKVRYLSEKNIRLINYQIIFKKYEQDWNFIPVYQLNLPYIVKNNITFPDTEHRFETEIWNAEYKQKN